MPMELACGVVINQGTFVVKLERVLKVDGILTFSLVCR